MEKDQGEIGKIEDEDNDEDNLGKDNYFNLERKNDSLSSESDDDISDNTIPNINNYLNKTPEINEIIENPQINQDKNIIKNTIDEDNFNMGKMKNNINKSGNNTNNIYAQNSYNNNKINLLNVNKINPGNNSIKNKNDLIAENNPNKDKITEETIENISSDDEDVNIIPENQFVQHFQGKEESGRKIKIIDTNEFPMKKNMKEILKKNYQKKSQNEEKIFNTFFMDKNAKNNKTNEIPNDNNKINFNINKNKIKKNKTRDFIPMPKEEMKMNKYFDKLLINRVEHQILTNIYDTYEDKSLFPQTYYHINEIKKLITFNGVEDAMKYLEDIEPLELRKKVAIESTYFFKEVVREEVENAKAHNGQLIIIKQPDYLYYQNMNLCGQINHNEQFNRKGKSNMRNQYYNYGVNNFQRSKFNPRMNNYNNNFSHFYGYNNNKYNYFNNNNNNNPIVYQGNYIPKKRNFNMDDE